MCCNTLCNNNLLSITLSNAFGKSKINYRLTLMHLVNYILKELKYICQIQPPFPKTMLTMLHYTISLLKFFHCFINNGLQLFSVTDIMITTHSFWLSVFPSSSKGAFAVFNQYG